MDSVASHLVSVGNNAFQQEETKVFSFFWYVLLRNPFAPKACFQVWLPYSKLLETVLMRVMYTTSVAVKAEP